jgi:hypothetical protein
MGPSLFACQYLLDPVPEGMAIIRQEWFEQPRFDAQAAEDAVLIDGVPEDLNVFMAVDPAYSAQSYADNTAMIIGGMDEKKICYLLDGFCGHLPMEQFKELVLTRARKWGVVQVGWEASGLQGEILKDIAAYFDENDAAFSIKPLYPTKKGFSTKDKPTRIIQTIQPILAQGRVRLSNNPVWARLIHECVRLPGSRTFDFTDAFAYLIWLLKAAAGHKHEEPISDAAWMKRHRRAELAAELFF